MELKVIKKFRNNRYGEVYSVSLSDNNIPNNRKTLRNLIGSEFEIDENNYILRGFSAFWDYEDKVKDDKIIFILYKI